MSRVVDFGVFRPTLEKALADGDGAKGGRPPYEPVATFKALILAAQNTVSDARMEFLIRDRLSRLWFLPEKADPRELSAPAEDAILTVMPAEVDAARYIFDADARCDVQL